MRVLLLVVKYDVLSCTSLHLGLPSLMVPVYVGRVWPNYKAPTYS